MGRKGNCWDNAVAESLFSSSKNEPVKKHIYTNRELALNDIANNIDTSYYRTRRRANLGGTSPERRSGSQAAQAALSTKS